jgi:hypothetical protein
MVAWEIVFRNMFFMSKNGVDLAPRDEQWLERMECSI